MKKNLFSQILSACLALCMAIALLPATALAADETEAGYTIVYDFIDNYAEGVPYTSGETGFFTPTLNLVDTYEKSNGFWKFDEKEGGLYVNHVYSADKEYNNGFIGYFGAGKSWYSINIKVPVAGSYSMTISYKQHSTYDTNSCVYVLEGDATSESIASAISEESGMVGSFNATKGAWDVRQYANIGTVELAAGENTVVFHSPNNKNFVVTGIELTSGDGSLKAPMQISAMPNKSTLDAMKSGDSAVISINSVTYSDTSVGTEGISANDFVFKSSDEKLATVDATGKVMVAQSATEGKVDISISAKNNPEFVLGTLAFDITATSSNTKIVYDFIDNYAEGVPYTSGENNFFTHSGVNEVSTYAESNGFWKFEAMEGALSVNHQYNATSAWANGLMAYYGADASWYAIKIRVPETDIYTASIGTIATSGHETNLEIYVVDGDFDAAAIVESINSGIGKLGSVDCTKGGYSAIDSERRMVGKIKLAKGEHIVVFHAANGKNAKVWSFALSGGNGSNVVPMKVDISASDVEVGKSSAITLDNVYMSDATESTAADGITYESSDSSILIVSGNVVAGKKAGNATIYAKYNGEIIGYADVAVSEPPISENVSFVATAVNGAEISVSGFDYNGAVDSVTPGKTVTVTAPEVDGYKFRYWKNGYKNGRYVSAEAEYTFKLVTHTYLTAVYDKIEEGKVTVEFFNGNGEFVESKSVVIGSVFGNIKPADPKMTGFNFLKWSIDDALEINSDTRAVAIYDELGKAVSGSVTADGEPISHPKYDQKVICEKSGATHWLRDGKVVAYGESYTHFIWGATSITSSSEKIEKIPVVVLENTKVDNAYMIEYDGAGYDVVEAGIIFGSGDISVASCNSKATSQRNSNHGQFTATPAEGETVARGYLIYNDGSVNRVVYSK